MPDDLQLEDIEDNDLEGVTSPGKAPSVSLFSPSTPNLRRKSVQWSSEIAETNDIEENKPVDKGHISNGLPRAPISPVRVAPQAETPRSALRQEPARIGQTGAPLAGAGFQTQQVFSRPNPDRMSNAEQNRVIAHRLEAAQDQQQHWRYGNEDADPKNAKLCSNGVRGITSGIVTLRGTCEW